MKCEKNLLGPAVSHINCGGITLSTEWKYSEINEYIPK